MEPKMIEEIIVDGAPFVLEHRDIPVEQIKLDERNPRIQYRLELNRGTKTLDEVILGMPEVTRLRTDIKHNGGLREKIIVQDVGDGTVKVLEGNCRTVCFRSLLKMPDCENPELWSNIPARVVPSDVEERKVAILLSDMHVAGKIQWKAHEKAGQIFRMSRELMMSQSDIATYLRQSKTVINRLLQAYSLMQDVFFKIDDGKYAAMGENKWSFFDELYRSKDLRAEIDTNPDFKEEFCRWVGEGRLSEGLEVRKLGSLLKHAEARKKFSSLSKDEAFREAMKTAEAADPELGSDFFKLLRQVREACTDVASVKEILRIRTDRVAREQLIETHEALQNFMRLAEVDPDDLAA